MRKINFRKSQGIYQVNFEICTLTVIQKFLVVFKLEKSLDSFCFSKQIHRKQSLGAQRQDKTRKTRLKRIDDNAVTESQYLSNLLSFIRSNNCCKDNKLKICFNFFNVYSDQQRQVLFMFSCLHSYGQQCLCTVNYPLDGHLPTNSIKNYVSCL